MANYDLLDVNNGILYSSDSWGLISTRYGEYKDYQSVAVRDNSTGEYVLDWSNPVREDDDFPYEDFDEDSGIVYDEPDYQLPNLWWH